MPPRPHHHHHWIAAVSIAVVFVLGTGCGEEATEPVMESDAGSMPSPSVATPGPAAVAPGSSPGAGDPDGPPTQPDDPSSPVTTPGATTNVPSAPNAPVPPNVPGDPDPNSNPGSAGADAGPAPAPSNGALAAKPSAGCANAAMPASGPLTLEVAGLARSYIVSLPEDYDSSTPYPLVFAFHGLGGSAELVSGSFYFGFAQTGGKPTIFVYPDGLDEGDGAGWPNTDGRDVAFFDALLSTLKGDYCVDEARVFSTGHSYGGMMSHTLGCQRAEVLRGIAPVAGAHFGRGGECSGPVAAWGAHGDPDETVAYENGLAAIERLMEANGCDPDSGAAVAPTENCTLYACDSGYPVTWCVHDEGHNWPRFAAAAIKEWVDSF